MVVMRTLDLLLLALGVGILSCSGSDGTGLTMDDPRSMTAIDSLGDTVVAITTGDVPAAFEHRLVEELRIAPAIDDTSLFTRLFEFDVDAAGRIWAYDLSSNSIFVFGADGSLVRRVGREGGGPGEFRSNGGMVIQGDGGLAVWDSQNGRISFFDSIGVFLTSWVTPTNYATSRALVTDKTGTLYLRRPIADPVEGEVIGRIGLVRLGADGRFVDSLAPPLVNLERSTYTATRKTNGGRSSSSMVPPFAARAFGTWHPEGYFVVANGETFDITLARQTKKPLIVRRKTASIAVDPAQRAEERERVLFQMRRTDPEWSWDGPPIPEAKAPLQGLFVARDGMLWARVATASTRIPEEELDPPRVPGLPVRHFRSSTLYELFDAEGRFRGRVPFEQGGSMMAAEENLVWVLEGDADGLPAIVRYRLDPPLKQ